MKCHITKRASNAAHILTPAKNVIVVQKKRKKVVKLMSNATERKDELIISALLANPTVTQASKACGISPSQIHKRLHDRAFKERYDAKRRELLEQSTAYVQGITSSAITKMHEVMTDENVSQQTQLNAAEMIIRTQLRLTEQVDILTQIAELKKAVFHE